MPWDAVLGMLESRAYDLFDAESAERRRPPSLKSVTQTRQPGRDDLDERQKSLLDSVIWRMKKAATQARRFIVGGRVQGVGYRIFAQNSAGELGLRGYVRNRRDGRVEVFAMGTAEKLRQFSKELEKGPMMARVTEVNEEPATVDTRYADSFSVEYTV